MTSPLPVRFWNLIEVGVCWDWKGNLNTGGYGRYNGQLAHRLSWQSLVGPIPHGMTLDHLCRNRRCVDPDHLEVVSRGENVRRGIAAARSRQLRQAMTHCKRGHRFTLNNTYLAPKNGKRNCRTCRGLPVKGE